MMNITGYQCFNQNSKWLLLPISVLSHSRWLLIRPDKPLRVNIHLICSSVKESFIKIMIWIYRQLSLCWDFHCNRERYELVGIYLVWTGITILMAVKTPEKQIPPWKDVIETPPRQWSELLPLALCDHLLVPFWPHLCDHPGSFLLVVLLTFHTYDIWHIWKIFMVTNCGKHKSDSVYLKVTLLSKSSS